MGSNSAIKIELFIVSSLLNQQQFAIKFTDTNIQIFFSIEQKHSKTFQGVSLSGAKFTVGEYLNESCKVIY